jgi:Flp pilus assembly pilin Flp
MKAELKRTLRNESGQGMTEYIIIVALIAIAAIGVVTLFGDNIRDMFGASAQALSGDEAATRTMSKKSNIATHKDLNSFAKNTEGASFN